MWVMFLFFVAMLAVWVCITGEMFNTIDVMKDWGLDKTRKGRMQIAAMQLMSIVTFGIILGSFLLVLGA